MAGVSVVVVVSWLGWARRRLIKKKASPAMALAPTTAPTVAPAMPPLDRELPLELPVLLLLPFADVNVELSPAVELVVAVMTAFWNMVANVVSLNPFFGSVTLAPPVELFVVHQHCSKTNPSIEFTYLPPMTSVIAELRA